MKSATFKRRKRSTITHIFIFVVGVLLCLLVYMLEDTKKYAPSVLCVFIGVYGTTIAISISLCAQMDKRWLFGETCVIEKKRLLKDKWIPYSNIQVIVVCSAVDRNYSPLCDEIGMPKSVIAIFDNWNIAQNYMHSESVLILPAISFDGVLSCSFFTNDLLQSLMSRTSANVFISQKAYTGNTIALDSIDREFENRIFISVSSIKAQGTFAFQPYRGISN